MKTNKRILAARQVRLAVKCSPPHRAVDGAMRRFCVLTGCCGGLPYCDGFSGGAAPRAQRGKRENDRQNDANRKERTVKAAADEEIRELRSPVLRPFGAPRRRPSYRVLYIRMTKGKFGMCCRTEAAPASFLPFSPPDESIRVGKYDLAPRCRDFSVRRTKRKRSSRQPRPHAAVRQQNQAHSAILMYANKRLLLPAFARAGCAAVGGGEA